ncbi:MAG TPA: pitrilysin family protein [Gemmatimonadales bacterium]|nr:pitrilysin family protein [Gemmatimonadales bacterium]
MFHRRWTLALLLLAASATSAGAQAAPVAPLQIPIDYRTLPNGLKVVLSRDTTTPTVAVAVYYNIGFRIEPRDRTGFAHLFEHMMFQGSRNLGKMEFIKLVQANGGILNGSTRFDFTNYYQVVPSHVLETMLWAEADRMKGLAIDTANLVNQQGVVKNEVKVNVLNQPYGGFPWIDMPMAANTNWYNAHNFYGELKDLDAATLEDVEKFFRTYYAPNNAALVVVGDFEPATTWRWVERYFGGIPAVPQPAKPDISEPRQEEERRKSRTSERAPRPALAVGYHLPERYTPEWYAFGLIDQLMGQGRDSWFYQELVQKRALTGDVSASPNDLGNLYNYDGPMLWTVSVYHDADVPADSIVAAMDSRIAELQAKPVDAATLERARVKLRSAFYSTLESLNGFGKADLLACFALFENDPALINRIMDGFAKVTPDQVQRTAREYLRPTNRTIVQVLPGAQAVSAGAPSEGN